MNKNAPFMGMIFLMSILGFASTSNWFFMWLVMEMNTLTFISLFYLNKNKSEAMVLYFLTQSLGSFFFLVSVVWAENYTNGLNTSLLLLLSILMKMGLVPFHNWLYSVISSSNKIMLYALLILQKIIPFMWIMGVKMFNTPTFFVLAVVNMFWISPQNTIQSSLKMIIGLSSMAHTSWILMSLIMVSNWEMYFLIYAVMFSMVIFLSKESLLSMLQVNNSYFILLVLFMLGGIPPLLGFYPKMLVLQNILNEKLILGAVTLILLSLVDLFVYSRLSVLSSILSKKNLKWVMASPMSMSFLTANFLLLPLLWI